MECSHQLGGSQDMRFDAGLKLVAAPTLRQVGFQVEGEQGEDISVWITGRRAGTVVACMLKIVNPVSAYPGNLLNLRGSFEKFGDSRGNVIQYPMNKNSAGGIRVFADERQGLGPRRHVEPSKGRGEIQSFAGESGRDGLSFGKGG